MYTFSLDSAFPLSISGAKAFHLSKMKSAGYPIPAGFVITTKAFDDFYKNKCSLTAEMKEELMFALNKIGAEKYMVRSSAIGEDDGDASFAGQLDSFISPSEPEAIIENIYKCWASYEKENIAIYERKSGKKLEGMGVVIQQLIEPDYAGVIFTRHPANESEMLIEYVEGHAEKLVSGSVSPESFIYSRDSEKIEHVTPFDFSVGIKTAQALEYFYGHPLDIEWTLKNKVFQVVQARPITTHAKSKLFYWSNTNVNENYPEAISPLLYSIARDAYYNYFKNLSRLFLIPEEKIRSLEPAYANVIGIFGCHMYYNMSSIHNIISSSPYSEMLLQSFDNFVGYAADKKKEIIKTKGSKFKFLLETIKFNFKLKSIVNDFEKSANQYEKQVNEAIAYHELRDCFHGFIEIRMHSWYKASLADFFAMLHHGALGKFCSKFYGKSSEGIHNQLIQAIPGLISSQPIVLIYKIKMALRSDAVVYTKFQNNSAEDFYKWINTTPSYSNINNLIDDYIVNWGFRCSGELMLTAKNYCEEPEKFILLLQQYDKLPDSDPEVLIAKKYEERQQVIKNFKKKIAAKNGLIFPLTLIQIGLLNLLIKLASKGISARERVRLKQALLYFKFKQVVEKTGKEFQQRGLIDNANEILFLRYQEISENYSSSDMLAGNLKGIVHQRIIEFNNKKENKYPDDFMSHIGEYPLANAVKFYKSESTDTDKVLKGLSVCGGQIKGRAKVLNSVLEAYKLEKGDIMVTRQTDPGWVVVFPLISGLIVERGGMLSHGAIVSREFGIPAIVGIENVVTKIKDGDLIFLNADTGEITICDE
jgi:pyruvate,water dikinase